MAPEIIEGKSYDGFKADVFSLGVCILAIAHWRFPFSQATISNNLYSLIYKKDFNQFWSKLDKNNDLSDSFKEMVQSMLSYNPEDRPSVSDLQNHLWMK